MFDVFCGLVLVGSGIVGFWHPRAWMKDLSPLVRNGILSGSILVGAYLLISV